MRVLTVGLLLILAQLSAAAASDASGKNGIFDNPDIAALKTSNPLGGDFMLLINQFNYSNKDGDISRKDRDQYFHIFQPVIPLSMKETIGDDWIWVNRPTVTFAYSADIPTGVDFANRRLDFSKEMGISDFVFLSLLGTSVEKKSEVFGDGERVLAAGLSVSVPIGTDGLTTDTWAAGPALGVGYIGKKFILGSLVQSLFGFAGENGADADDFQQIVVQPFYFANFEGGWQIGATPVLTFDLKSNEYEIPLAMGVQKTALFDIGGPLPLPVRFGVEGRVFVESNSAFGTNYEVVLSVSPIMPNIFENWIKGCPTLSVGGC